MSTKISTQNVEYFFEYFFENFFENFFETFTMIKPTSVRDKLTNEWAAVVLLEKNLPSPRSPSFTTPSAVIKTLAGLMSLKPITLASKTSNAS